ETSVQKRGAAGYKEKPLGRRQVAVQLRNDAVRLLGHYKVAAAVLLPAIFVAFHAEGLFLAVAHGAHTVRADAQRNQVLFYGCRAAIAERQVVLRRAALVAVALN